MIRIILEWIIPFILTAIFGFIAKELKENKNNNNAMRESMVLLLRSQITGKCETYLKMEYLPIHFRKKEIVISCSRIVISDTFLNFQTLKQSFRANFNNFIFNYIKYPFKCR